MQCKMGYTAFKVCMFTYVQMYVCTDLCMHAIIIIYIIFMYVWASMHVSELLCDTF